MQLQDALGRFLTQLEADGRSINTRKQYERHIRLLAAWLGDRDRTAVEDIDHEVLASFLASPEARARASGGIKRAVTLNALRTSIRMFFRWCHDAGYVAVNPARLIRRANCSSPPPRGLATAEQERLLAAIDHPRDRALFETMLLTGIRVSAALDLAVEDVDLGGGWLSIRTKGDRRERLPLSRHAVEVLRVWIGDRTAGPLWGRTLSTRHVQRRLGRWVAKAGVRGSPHALRHSFALDLYRRCGDVLVVQKALGHRSIASTLVYARADERRLREVLDG